MKSKVVKLKNNLKAKLVFSQIDDYYTLFAKDEGNNVVGCCNFSVVMNYARELTSPQREMFAKKKNLKPEEVQSLVFVHGSPQKFSSYEQVENGVKIGNNIYTHVNNYCTLDKIEIRDARYHKVGLGTEMLNYVIDFAKQQNCYKIDAFVYPNGEFKFSTLQFYKRNGFVFDKNNNATKQLLELEESVDKNINKE